MNWVAASCKENGPPEGMYIIPSVYSNFKVPSARLARWRCFWKGKGPEFRFWESWAGTPRMEIWKMNLFFKRVMFRLVFGQSKWWFFNIFLPISFGQCFFFWSFIDWSGWFFQILEVIIISNQPGINENLMLQARFGHTCWVESWEECLETIGPKEKIDFGVWCFQVQKGLWEMNKSSDVSKFFGCISEKLI